MSEAEFSEIHADAYAQYSRSWRKNTLSTDPINKPRATEAIKTLYKIEGREEPRIIWTKSPLASLFTKVIADHHLNIPPDYKVWPSFSKSLEISVIDKIDFCKKTYYKVFYWYSLDDLRNFYNDRSHIGEMGVRHVGSILKTSVSRAVSHSRQFLDLPESNEELCLRLWRGVSDSLEQSFGASYHSKLKQHVTPEFLNRIKGCIEANRAAIPGFVKSENSENYDKIDEAIRAAVDNAYYTQYDAAKLSEYMFFSDADLVPKNDAMIELSKICSSVGTVMPEGRICYVSDRPEIIKLDSEDRLHCEDGPAMIYSDGFAIHAWHGQRFPAGWIQNPPNPSEALQWPNLEQRRIACEIVGWDNIINELGGQLIDKNDDPEIGELVRVNLPDIGTHQFLRVRCGTGRNFTLPVPPEMRTALQANAWTWGLTPHEYKPEIRT